MHGLNTDSTPSLRWPVFPSGYTHQSSQWARLCAIVSCARYTCTTIACISDLPHAPTGQSKINSACQHHLLVCIGQALPYIQWDPFPQNGAQGTVWKHTLDKYWLLFRCITDWKKSLPSILYFFILAVFGISTLTCTLWAKFVWRSTYIHTNICM